jgi:serine/threonine protein kinase
VFQGTDTAGFDEYKSSAETLRCDEVTTAPSPEMHFLSTAEEGREEIDGYQVVRLLGKGGNNAVFKVRKDEKPFILKVPLYAGNYFKEKIRNERGLLHGIHEEISDRLKSGELVSRPNIIRMRGFRDDDLTYIVLELLEKELETDKKTKETGKKVSFLDSAFEQMQGNPVQIAMFLWDVLHALEFMHSLNIVHRDVKPQNCMTTHRGNKTAAVLYDFSEGLFLGDEESVRNAKPSMTPYYTARQFIKVIYGDYINKKKNFFRDCPMSRLASVLKANDYVCTAFAIAHLLTNIAPYTNWAYENEEDHSEPNRKRFKRVLKQKNVIDEVANKATETKPASPAAYAGAIYNFKEDPIHREKIEQIAMGNMFLKVIDLLMNPMTVSTGLKPVYELLQREVNQPGLFTDYTPEDTKLAKHVQRR